MIYYLFWPLTKFSILLYFRKIFVTGANHVPRKGPLLIVCNHPSSFFEPCVLAVVLPRALHFLTRGDFFKNKFFVWFLNQTHQVPIFRSEDGFDKLRANQDTFSYCYDTLGANKVIVIFPETKTETEKRLRPVQKGAARIAFGALQREVVPQPLSILPIGVTFSDPVSYRSLVTIRCGEVIPVHVPNPAMDIRDQVTTLTSQIEQALKSQIIQIDARDREPLFDALQLLLFNGAGISGFPHVTADPRLPGAEQRLASAINAMSDDEAERLRVMIADYHAHLARHHINDRWLNRYFFWTTLGKILLLPLTLVLAIGKVLTMVPSWPIHRFLNAKVKRIPFYGPLKWVMGLLGYAIWFAIILVVGAQLGGTPGLLLGLAGVMMAFLNMQQFHDLDLRGLLAPLWISKKRRREILEARERLMGRVF